MGSVAVFAQGWQVVTCDLLASLVYFLTSYVSAVFGS